MKWDLDKEELRKGLQKSNKKRYFEKTFS